MKAVRIIFIFPLAFLISCGAEEKPVEPENPFAELTEIFEDLSDELSEIDGVQEIYALTRNSAGDFKIGDKIPVSTDVYTVDEEEITYDTEEGPSVQTVHIVSEENEDLLQIRSDYDSTISEMNIFSDRFETAEGIGVGSTITEFIAAYPDYKIWYTYVSDRYVIESESVGGQYLLDRNAFQGKTSGSSDMEMLSLEDFKADAEIMSIRMYKF